jgi:hypothetical protein
MPPVFFLGGSRQVTRAKQIRNASIVALAVAVGIIFTRQQLDPESPLSRKEREYISQLRKLVNQASVESDDPRLRALARILSRLSQQGEPTSRLSKLFWRKLTGRMSEQTSWATEALIEELETGGRRDPEGTQEGE